MADEKKTLKFQMMMSPAEAEALDDWMFKNRIRSRAEAIRRLWQMGMAIDGRLGGILKHNTEAVLSAGPALKDLDRLLADQNASAELQRAAHRVKIVLLEFIKKQSFETMSLYAQLKPLSGLRDIDAAIEMAGSFKEAIGSLDINKREDYDKLFALIDSLGLHAEIEDEPAKRGEDVK